MWRELTAVGVLVLCVACKQEAPPTVAAPPPAISTDVPQPPMPPAPGPAEPETISLVSEHCGWEVFVGRTDADASAGDMILDSEAPVVCAHSDGGVVWTLPGGESREFREAHFYRNMIRADRAAGRDEVTNDFIRRCDEDIRGSGNRCVDMGMLFRAPARMVGRMTRIEGTAHRVREENDQTVMTLFLDMLGHQRVDVIYPGLANSQVVDGAEMLIYGVATGSHTTETIRGEEVVPEVAAFGMIVRPPATPEQQMRRLMRRRRY